MNYPKIYAMIDETGTVHNRIIVDDYEEAVRSAENAFGDQGRAVECNQYKVFAGWKYINSQFYQPDGTTPAEYVPTEIERIEWLETQLAAEQEKNTVLAEEVTNTQLALTEIYEGMGV